MGFKIQGEVLIDEKKGVSAFKNVQREATKTSNSFDSAGTSTKQLAKSLLQLGVSGGSASRSFMQLARFGVGGIIGAAAAGAVNKFGEAVKNSATDYYETQKSLSGAFEQSFKSKSVEEAQAGLQATTDIAEKLRGKITQLGSFGKIMAGIEKFTGINLGFGDLDIQLKQAEKNLVVQEEIAKTRKRELEITTQTAEEMGGTARQNQRLIAQLDEEEGILEKNVVVASALHNEVRTRILTLEKEATALSELAYSEQTRALQIKNSNALYEQQTALIIANTKLEKAKADESKKAQAQSGGLLGASRGGQQTLDAARKRRQRENKQEDFKTQEKVFGKMAEEENVKRKAMGQAPLTMQDMKERVAAQQAAREAPSLANQIQGGMTGLDPAQIAALGAHSGFLKQGAGMMTQTPFGAPAGVPSTGAPDQAAEVLKAITKLVDLIGSAPLVGK